MIELLAPDSNQLDSPSTPEAYRSGRDQLLSHMAADPHAAGLVRKLEGLLRYEIEHSIPEEERVRARLSAPERAPGGRTALISDIHGNHEGLLAVLADIERQACRRVICLGDLVEGGTGNEAVIETLRARRIACVRGNHDEVNDARLPECERRFLADLPERIAENDVLYVHISPRSKKRKINHVVEAWNVFDESDWRLVFIGHVHVPMIFGERSHSYGEAALHAFEYNRPFPLAQGERYIVCVGSVGYGRDLVGKLRYAIYDADADTVELRALDGPLLSMDHALGGATIEFL